MLRLPAMKLADLFLLPLLLLLAPGVRAEAVAAAAEPGGNLLQLLLGFGTVLLLLFGSLWLLKRLTAPRGTAVGVMRVVAGTAVGPRERVVIVEVGEVWLVLGVAPGSVSTLHQLPRAALAAAAQETRGKDFAAWLKQVVDRRHAG